MKKYIVEVTNEILGNSKHIMTREEIKKFNLCVYGLCKNVDVAGGIHTSGMWSVKEYRDEVLQRNISMKAVHNKNYGG